MQRAWMWLGVAVAVGFVSTSAIMAQDAGVEKGVVVEEVGEGSALEKVGLRPGDVLLAWERLPAPPANPEGAQGVIESVFDWMWLKVEQAPRGTVKLTGQRDGEVRVFEVDSGEWKATLRPIMMEEMLEDYAWGKELIEAEKLETGIVLWHKLVNHATDYRIKCWLLLRIGDAWSKTEQWEKAHSTYISALESAQDPLATVAVWQVIGDAYRRVNEFEGARQAYTSAQEVRDRTWRESLIVAAGLNDLGALDWEQSSLDSAQSYWQRALEIRQKLAPGSLDMAASLNNLGNLANARGNLAKAAENHEKALEIRQKLAPGSFDVATSLNNLGNLARARGDLDRAIQFYESSLKIFHKLGPGSLHEARGLSNLGSLALDRSDLGRAAEYYEESLEILQNLVPGSLDVAVALTNLANLAHRRGNYDRAIRLYEESLEMKEKLAPGSLDVAVSLNGLGVLTYERGDLEYAAECHERALDILRDLVPGNLNVAMSLNNLGLIAQARGDLDKAVAYYQEALEIQQASAPDSLHMALILHNLGVVAHTRGDFDRAEFYYERSLEIQQELVPGSLYVATCLNSLGLLASARHDSDKAVEYYEESLKIFKNLAPGSLQVAAGLGNLGNLAFARGEYDHAAAYYGESLEIQRKLAPKSLDVARSLHNLGSSAYAVGDLDRAVRYHENSLEIQQNLAPGSSAEALMLYDLATVYREQGQVQKALAFFLQALQVLESQIARLGGSREVQAGFRADRELYYRETIELLLELQRPQEAFQTLERSRARSFLDQLAERDLVFSDVPEGLEQQRRQIASSYEKTQAEIAQNSPKERAEEIELFRKRLQRLRWNYEDITGKIMKASPKLGALRYPQPLDLNGVRQVLDPGTVMLSYDVGKESSHLFVLTREDRLQVKALPLGKEELRSEVQIVLRLQRTRSTAPYKEPLFQVGKRLYQALILPAEKWIAKSDRVVIVPDGPLHLLPFALLVRETEEAHGDRGFEYLVEWKPLHSVLSATVYAELKKERRNPTDKDAPGLSVAAFGDPQYPSRKAGTDLAANRGVDVYVRSAAERGFDFSPLPFTREEVTRIAALYPEGAVRTYLGAEASEENAKSLGRGPRILHFATHGRYDDKIAMNSFLALSLPEKFHKDRENGLLQVWEIYEDVRLDADLVVLSGCETGVGDELDGEGLIGLTRAFQFAGARTVAATLWQVEDRATAELMTRFYHHLRAGMAKDEALRAAQIELIRGPVEMKNRQGRIVERDLSLPYYWAAFQVIGDWQ